MDAICTSANGSERTDNERDTEITRMNCQIAKHTHTREVYDGTDSVRELRMRRWKNGWCRKS